MGNTFEQVSDETIEDCFIVAKKAVLTDSWTIYPSVFSSEGAATQKAQQLVSNPDNNVKAVVMLPNGAIFKDVE